MTSAEARKILQPPLIFGNEAQIKALAFLEEVEECKLSILACEYADRHLACNLKVLFNCDCIEKWVCVWVRGADIGYVDNTDIPKEALREAKKRK